MVAFEAFRATNGPRYVGFGYGLLPNIRRLTVVFGLSLLALAFGDVIARGKLTVAATLLLLPVAGWALSRRQGALLAGLALVLLLPSWYTLGTAQAGVLRVACICALFTVLLNRRTQITRIDMALGAFVVIVVIGWLLQNNQTHVGRLVLTELQPVAFFLAARSLLPRDAQKAFAFAFFLGTLGAITVLYELRLGHIVFADPARYYWNGSETNIFRPGGIFGSPPAASTVLTFTALCGLPVLRRTSGWYRGFAGMCMGITLIAMVSTFTRTALIAFSVSLFAYLWISRSPMLNHQRVVIGLAVLLLAFVFFLPRLESGRTFQEGVLRGGTFAARVEYWKLALPIAASNDHNLFFGIGSEALEVPTVGGTALSAIATSPVLIEHGTHNQYVLTLVEQGLVGLLALLAWLGMSFSVAVRYARASKDPTIATAAAGLLAVAIIMLTDNMMLNGPSLALAMLFSGSVISISRLWSTDINQRAA